jgi:hypothetical protein
MTLARLKTVFLIDAVYSVITGLVLLMSTWDDMLDKLGLVYSVPAINGQFAGALLLGFAWILWRASKGDGANRPLAEASLIGNGLTVGIVVAWLVDGGLEPDTHLKVNLVLVAAISAAFVVAYAAALRGQALRSAA